MLIVDEAHLLNADQLEELRLLTNADMDSASPVRARAGRPAHPRARLRLGSFAALDQRITLRYALPPMTATDTADYIAHHLKLAGRSDTLFSDDAIARIHKDGMWGPPRFSRKTAAVAYDGTRGGPPWQS